MVCMSAATDEIVEKLKTLSVSIQAEYCTNEERTSREGARFSRHPSSLEAY